jgi:hypothetical protein
MVNMLPAAKRARRRQHHRGIQDLVAGRVGCDATVFPDLEIRTFKRLVVTWADKNEFYQNDRIQRPYRPAILNWRSIRLEASDTP